MATSADGRRAVVYRREPYCHVCWTATATRGARQQRALTDEEFDGVAWALDRRRARAKYAGREEEANAWEFTTEPDVPRRRVGDLDEVRGRRLAGVTLRSLSAADLTPDESGVFLCLQEGSMRLAESYIGAEFVGVPSFAWGEPPPILRPAYGPVTGEPLSPRYLLGFRAHMSGKAIQHFIELELERAGREAGAAMARAWGLSPAEGEADKVIDVGLEGAP